MEFLKELERKNGTKSKNKKREMARKDKIFFKRWGKLRRNKGKFKKWDGVKLKKKKKE